MFERKKGQTYYTNRHSCFLLQYHMVLVTKYRHPVLTGVVKDVVYQTIRDIFSEKGLVRILYRWYRNIFVTNKTKSLLGIHPRPCGA